MERSALRRRSPAHEPVAAPVAHVVPVLGHGAARSAATRAEASVGADTSALADSAEKVPSVRKVGSYPLAVLGGLSWIYQR